ncbi:extracellular catalytic domain type 1 short-chain-length polyhydroxyalkanoate depolymerase [Methylobacterium planeticum]|uniref:PHB depolymerase family esterase n=1 Tax=Methylobacterium planeticum TaxID=2615211 RepID=A0A6N6MX19_9HYPH|nr:PHB depolymerase family esterase [Methylobacterium planeticum]KAB1075621.1 PHB depolymerase family esterase [Methylobacterium planeticum]
MTDHFLRSTQHLADMIEATRLTGVGRLQEATALIQRSFQEPAPETHPQVTPARTSPALESSTPESPAPESSTRQPPADAAARPSNPPPAAQAESHPNHAGPNHAGPLPPRLPERLRETLDGVVGEWVRGVVPMPRGLDGEDRADGRAAEPGRPGTGSGEGAFVALSFESAAGARDYKLFIPSRPAAAPSLVVMLHGCSQSPEDFAAGTDMNALAEAEGLFVAYPAQSGRANGQKCWNWFEPRDQGRESGEAAIIAGITRTVMEAHGIDPARVYIAGFSAGAAAAANVARAYPDLYAAVGVHSGLAAGCARDLSSAMMAMQMGAPGLAEPNGFGAPVEGLRLPTIVFHGDGDGTVSPRNGDQVLAQAGIATLAAREEAGEANGHAFTRTRYADARGQVWVESWLVRGSGHAWSGGSPAGSYTDPRGPDASRAMLAFFAGHRLGAGRRPVA